jgi:L-alanine-DL-glutamate epimerase-like enolase superfamily enzyme
MAAIESVEIRMVDLIPKRKRVDAIQSFVSQETPIVRNADGAVGVGYSYTIGTGGPAVVELITRSLAPALIGREAVMVEKVWRDLLFLTMRLRSAHHLARARRDRYCAMGFALPRPACPCT